MPSQVITLTLSTELLAKIEEAAKANYCTRSDYIRSSIVQRLNHQPIINATPGTVAPKVKQSEDEFLEQLTKRYTAGENC